MATATSGFTLLDEFMPDILQYVHGAPTILVYIHLRSAVIDFCRRTEILKRDPATIYLTENDHTYRLQYPNERYVAVACESVYITPDSTVMNNNETRLRLTTSHELDHSVGNWRNHTASKPEAFFLTEETNKIRFYPAPNGDLDDETVVQTCVTYKRDCNEVDEFLYEKWHDPIKAAALASLLMIPGASWFNEPLARSFAVESSRGIRQGRKVALQGTGKHPGQVVPRSFVVLGPSSRRSFTWE